MDETGDHHVERDKPSSKSPILYVPTHSYVKPRSQMMITIIILIILIVGCECKRGTVGRGINMRG
jgi:hypothetical protein